MKSLNQLRQALGQGDYRFPDPKIELEQYFTPVEIAAYCVWSAFLNGDIENKMILDLGCGTGVLAHASALLGASMVTGVDIDISAVARASNFECDANIDFFVLKVTAGSLRSLMRARYHTTLTNPPFGTKQQDHADTIFVREALSVSNVVYSFHLSASFDFLRDWARREFPNVDATLVARVDYCIEKTYRKHKRESKPVKVDILRWVHLSV